INLSKKCSDFSLSPLKIGGGTPDSTRLPLASLVSAGGAGAVTVAATSSISTWGVAAISSGMGVSVGGYIMCRPLTNCGSVSFQCPSWKKLLFSICSPSVVYQLRFVTSAVSCLRRNQLCPVWRTRSSVIYSYARNSTWTYLLVSGFLIQYPRSSVSLFQWASLETCPGKSPTALVRTIWYCWCCSPKLNGKAASLSFRKSLTYVTLLRALRPDVG